MHVGPAQPESECVWYVCFSGNYWTHAVAHTTTHPRINFSQMPLKNKKIVCCIICIALTSSLFTVHVRFAAGRECRDVQLPRNMSPTRYRGRMPVMNGALCGVSVKATKVQRQKGSTSLSLSLSLCEYECVSVYLRVYTFVFLTIDCHYSVWYTASRERARILPNSEAPSCLPPSRYIRNPSPPTFRHSCNDSRGLIFAATQSIIEMLLSTCT